ncbi:MAG: hypothetical protein JWO79_2017 [Actinomycetia bacterium]|nr:hypothetical protein [Actinomycetes bacterium]
MSGYPRPAVPSPLAAARAVPAVLLAVLLSALAAFAVPGIAAAEPPGPVKYYVVQASYQGQPEFLFEIAQRFLGSGARNTEIFALNKGRLEPGGARMTDPASILPGWILRLPADAKGDGVRTGPLPTPGASAEPPTESPGESLPPAAENPGGAVRSAEPSAGEGTGGLPATALVLLVVGLVALAGCAAGVVLIRRRSAAVKPTSPAAPTPGDLTASWTVDRALRTLSAACAQSGRSLPELYAVTLGPGEVTLRLTAPDDDAPAPWSPDSTARTWSAPLAELQSAPVDPSLGHPYPRLVTAGIVGGGRVLLDLSQARGVIGIDGDSRVRRAIAARWATELTTNPWSEDVPVVRVGFGGTASGSYANMREASAALAASRAGVLLFAAPPSGRDAAELRALLGTPGSDWSVVVSGTARDARWRFTASSDGQLDTGFLGMSIQAAGGEPVALRTQPVG